MENSTIPSKLWSLFNLISNEFMNIMITFSDGVTGHLHDSATGFMLAFWFFIFAIVMITRRIVHNGPCFTTSMLLVGSCFGVYRNGFMFLIDYGFTRGYFHRTTILASVPIIDHTFQLLTLLSFCYIILYKSEVSERLIKYFYLIFAIPFIIYVILGRYWSAALTYYSASLDERICYCTGEEISHGISLALLIPTLIIAIKHRSKINATLLYYIVFTIAGQIYPLIDTITMKAYCDILIPFHNSYYLWAIPFIVYYVQLIPVHENCLVYQKIALGGKTDEFATYERRQVFH